MSCGINLCKYKDSLGEPNKGFHKHIFGIAFFDLLGTFIIAVLIAKYTKGGIVPQNVLIWFLILILLGIIFHRIFCVNTVINKAIFGKIS